jgi:beta-glucosidase
MKTTPVDSKAVHAKDFGNHFIWGVSSSALQTEGAHKTDQKGPSIWDAFADKGKIKSGHHHYQANEFYYRYLQDIDLIQQMGIPNFRFSLSWPRLLPDGVGSLNPKGIDFYHRVIDACLEKGIEPWVTLYHWDLPYLLEKKGGWTNREVIDWFLEYTQKAVKLFGDKVKHWMILNEPLVFTGAGYFGGVHAPGRKGLKNFLPASLHASICIAEGFRLVKDMQPKAQVGSTFSFSHLTPYSHAPNHLRACHKMDALLNRMFLEPTLGLGYPTEEIPALRKIEKYMKAGDDEKLKVPLDFIGVQVYTREVVKSSLFTPYLRSKLVPANERKVYHTKMNWEVYPKSIYEIVKKVQSYKGVNQIIVTENGASFEDELFLGRVEDLHRIHYLKQHMEELFKAKQDFHKLNGYFVWSLTDNFEWAEGYHQRFGLVYVDFETQMRFTKNSGYWYRDFLSGAGK